MLRKYGGQHYCVFERIKLDNRMNANLLYLISAVLSQSPTLLALENLHECRILTQLWSGRSL